MMKRVYLLLAIVLSAVMAASAQKNVVPASEKEAYLKVITQRAAKIAVKLNINDEAKQQRVTELIRDQYSDLNDIYTARDSNIKVIKRINIADKTALAAAIEKETAKTEAKLAKLHKKYLAKLSSQLNAAQVEGVKDGMTYGVLPITYKAYQEQILTLTEEQKKQILTWLTQAREHAMDAESSDKKHAWFGKYKGKINNYLSAAGYDLKKEGQEWEKRRKSNANRSQSR